MPKSPKKAHQRTRQPQRCTKCKGRPLRSECIHTTKGKKHCQAQQVQVPTTQAQEISPTQPSTGTRNTSRGTLGSESLATNATATATHDAGREHNTPNEQDKTGRRCQVCLGKPLRSQCTHTAKGRAFLAQQAAGELVSSLTRPDSPINIPVQPVPQQRAEQTYLYPGHADHVPPFNFHSQPVHYPGERDRGPAVLFNAVMTPFTPYRRSTTSNSAEDDMNIDPSLRTTPQTTPSACSSDEPTSPSSPGPLRGTSESDPFFSSPPTSASANRLFSGKKIKPTQARPLYGHVVGVKRGNADYSIYRTKPFPSVIENSRKASQRFSRLANKIVERCEALSRETGAWLFFGAQHTSARGGPLSYASPRLRREAMSATDALATSFNDTVSTLLSARRIDNADIQRRYQESEVKRLAAEKEALIQAETLSRYRVLFGDLPVPR